MSVLVWSMVGIALWHFTVLLPDKFAGGIIGAFLAALIGALVSGYALPAPGLPTENPPGLSEAIWALPGSLMGLAGSYVWALASARTSDGHVESNVRSERERSLDAVSAGPSATTRPETPKGPPERAFRIDREDWT